MAGELLYLDSSALVKLVVAEAESTELTELVENWQWWVSSRIAAVEVVRAISRAGASPSLAARGDVVMSRIAFVELDPAVARTAGLEPSTLRALDAIHLASALSLGTDLGGFVTYDDRQRRAAETAAIETLSPGVRGR